MSNPELVVTDPDPTQVLDRPVRDGTCPACAAAIIRTGREWSCSKCESSGAVLEVAPVEAPARNVDHHGLAIGFRNDVWVAMTSPSRADRADMERQLREQGYTVRDQADLDRLTSTLTGRKTFAELVIDPCGSSTARPSIMGTVTGKTLAMWYDHVQVARGDARRAHVVAW